MSFYPQQTTAESSPADIYNMIPEKDPTVLPVDADLKPILKTHSPGDKQNVVPPVQQPPTDQATMVTKGPQAGFEPHKVMQTHHLCLNRVVPANLLLFAPFDHIIFADFVRLH